MASAQAELLAEMMEFETNFMIWVADGIPEDKRMMQMRDGKAHPLWLLGHVAETMSGRVIGMILGQQPVCPKEYGPLFTPDLFENEPIQSDAGHYPPWDEMLENYKKTAATAIEGIRGLSDEDLARPPKGTVPDELKELFAVTRKTIIAFVLHNAQHRGQMSALVALG